MLRAFITSYLWLSCLAVMAATGHRLDLCATVPLPGIAGALDHFAIDPKAQRLFVTARDNNSLEILGLREARRLQSISGIRKPTAVAYLPRSNSICVASSEDGTLRIYDGGNYQPKQVIPGLNDADNMRYDSDTDRLYVGFGKGGIAIVDASQAQVAGMVKLPGHPEAFEVNRSNQTLLVNLPETKQIALVDLRTRAISKTWTLDRFQANFPMALDPAAPRLFVACRRPARLLVLDLQSGKPLADLEISGDADDLFYDAKRQRIYLSCGEGFVDVVEQTAEGYRRTEKIQTVPGARTSFFSPDLDLLAVGLPRRGNQDAEIRVYQPKSIEPK